jgi:hypothetical protein
MAETFDDFQDSGFNPSGQSPTNPMGAGGFTPMANQDQNTDGDIFGAATGMNFQGSSNGFGSNSGGFKPAGQWGFQPATGVYSPGKQEEDDLDDEEREKIAMVEQENENRKRRLYEQELQEEEVKKEKKIKAKQDLDNWQQQRQKETEQRRKNNDEQEKLYHEQVT